VVVLDARLGDIRAVCDGMESLECVFKTYGPSITYFFANRGFSPEECRDLTQDTFLRAVGGIRRFRGEAKLETWLMRIASNVWKNEVRSKRAAKRDAPTVSLEEAVEHGRAAPWAERLDESGKLPSPQARALELERKRLLWNAIATLPARMRRCVTLRLDRGLEYRAIATIMQVSVETVKTQLFQARQRLKEELRDYFDGEGVMEWSDGDGRGA